MTNHRHLNPIIGYAIAVILGILIGSALLFGMFTCHLANYPELGASLIGGLQL